MGTDSMDEATTLIESIGNAVETIGIPGAIIVAMLGLAIYLAPYWKQNLIKKGEAFDALKDGTVKMVSLQQSHKESLEKVGLDLTNHSEASVICSKYHKEQHDKNKEAMLIACKALKQWLSEEEPDKARFTMYVEEIERVINGH